jgi:23S rRNA pseudouridine1911/1915/1917 synthase
MPSKMEKIVQVIYEDNHLLVVNKPSGVLVQGDETGDKALVDYCKDYIKEKYNKPGAVFLGVVHRIDRPVSGLVIFARTSKALERMNALFRNKDIHKVYWAVVKRRPPEIQGKLVHYLIKDEKRNVSSAFEKEVEDSKRSELNYKVLGKLNDHYLLEIRPLTGRPHQIRVQLAAIGSPIRGDVKYGFPKANSDMGINLHAKDVYFAHPVTKEKIHLRAGLPNNQFWEQYLVLEEIKLKDSDIDKLY